MRRLLALIIVVIVIIGAGCGAQAEKEQKDGAAKDVPAASVQATVVPAPQPVDTAAPAPAAAPVGLAITEPADGELVSTENVVIRGTAPPDAEVKHDKTGTDASLKANGDGLWEYKFKLSRGKNTLNFYSVSYTHLTLPTICSV